MKSTDQIRRLTELNITLRKLSCKNKSLQQSEVMVVLRAGEEYFQIAKTRIIKNGVACFYGQSFCIPTREKQIHITVQDGEEKSQVKLASFIFIIAQLTNKKNNFVLDSEGLSLVFQGNLIHGHTHFSETEADRSFEDFEELKPIARHPVNQIRKMYSPMVKGEHRGKRMSFRGSQFDTVSERVSQSPQKMTLYTSDTFIRITRNKGSVKEKQQIKKSQKDNSEFIHPIFNPSKNKKPSKIQLRHPMTPQSTSSTSMFGKKKAEQMINKINIKSLIYTSMVGLISGVTAAKAMHI